MPKTFYLHGFASSPKSYKVQYFLGRSPELVVPDLNYFNQETFQTLTVSRQVQQVRQLLSEPSYLIGSSLGGLTAAILAEKYPELVKKIVLLAPAFRFTDNWQKRLGKEAIERWQIKGTLPIYHYSYEQEIDLHYGFFQDALTYCHYPFNNTVPTLIIHGIHDDVVPIEVSQAYAQDKPLVTLSPVDDDHNLGKYLPDLFARVDAFLQNS